MALKDRFPVFPTRMSEQVMKGKLKIAERGHKLLKRKSDALTLKFREVGQEIIEIKQIMGKVMKEAAYLLAETKYLTGDISNNILNRVTKARLRTRKRYENIAGVQILIFECYEAGGDEFGLTGLARGGERVNQLKRAYALATDILVQMATLQNAFKTLDAVIRSTNTRVNALEYRYIPKVRNTLKYIVDSLDENERQDFYRLKMVQNKKKKERREKNDLKGRREKDDLKEKKLVESLECDTTSNEDERMN